MTKAELVEEVARAAELNKRDAEVIVETVFDSIIGALHKGEKVELRGFGSFRTRERGPRRGRNPKTGEPVDVPAKRVPYFKPGKELKDFFTDSPEDGASGSGQSAGSSSGAGAPGDVPPGPYAASGASEETAGANASPAPNERSSGALAASEDSSGTGDSAGAGEGDDRASSEASNEASSESRGGEDSPTGSGY